MTRILGPEKGDAGPGAQQEKDQEPEPSEGLEQANAESVAHGAPLELE